MLKIAQWVDLRGTPLEHDYLNEPVDWNYWKREALAYQSGILNGWQGNSNAVRFACAASAALRYATYEVLLLHWEIADNEPGKPSWIDDLAHKHNLTIEATLIRWGTAIAFLFTLADEARQLAAQLEGMPKQ